MNAEDLRPHMDELKESMANIEKILARNVDTFAKITQDFVSDIRIVLRDMILPGHKYVLSSRCNVLAQTISTGADELDWTSYESSVGIALLRWFYTNEIVSANATVTLGLLRAAHYFELSTLFEACESKISSSIDEDCSREFYAAAKEVNAKMIMEKCMEWKSTFDEHSSQHQQLKIDGEDHLNSSYCSDIDLGIFSSSPLKPLSEELMELIRRNNEVNEGCTKLGKSLIGVEKYMEFFDTTIWSWPAHKYFLARRSKKLQHDTAWSVLSGLKASYEFDLMRWLYTNHIDIDGIHIALALLEASYKWELHQLFVICEDTVVQMISTDTCAQVHSVASKVSAVKALNECERVTAKYWDCIKSAFNEVPAHADKSTDIEGTICEFPLQNAEIEPAALLTLNDDCLLHLFRFLSLVDLGSVKDTCRRMSDLADRCFQLYGDKSLKIRCGSMVADLWKLKHFGKLIKCLSLEGLYHQYCSWTDVFLMIGRFANEQLKSIRLCINDDRSVTSDSLKCLGNVVKNVEKIEFDAFNDGGLLIESLLDHCVNLSEVHIGFCKQLYLSMSWCSKNQNIKSLTLMDLENDDVMAKMCEKLLHLESFTFSSFIITDKLNHLCRLNHLKQLKIVDVEDEFVDEIASLLRNLAEKNTLEHLSFLSYSVVEQIARAICDLSKLKELVFEHVESFEVNAINILSKKLKTVEKLRFLDCDEITFEDITKIVTNKLDLKELTVSRCESVDVIERVYYMRLRKRRNLQIFLDKEIFEKTMNLLAKDLSDYVTITAIANS